jgi:hypothetical protein
MTGTLVCQSPALKVTAGARLTAARLSSTGAAASEIDFLPTGGIYYNPGRTVPNESLEAHRLNMDSIWPSLAEASIARLVLFVRHQACSTCRTVDTATSKNDRTGASKSRMANTTSSCWNRPKLTFALQGYIIIVALVGKAKSPTLSQLAESAKDR